MKRQTNVCSNCGKEFTNKEKSNAYYNGNNCPNCHSYKTIDEATMYILPDGTETTSYTMDVLKMEVEEKWNRSNEDKLALIGIAIAAMIVIPILIGLLLCLLKLFWFVICLIFKFIFWVLF